MSAEGRVMCMKLDVYEMTWGVWLQCTSLCSLASMSRMFGAFVQSLPFRLRSRTGSLHPVHSI